MSLLRAFLMLALIAPAIPTLALLALVPTAFAAQSKPVLTITQFGADPTGVVDAGPAIQRASDAAAASGGNYIVVPPGTYLVNSQVNMSTGVWMHGEGQPRFILAYTDATSQPKIFVWPATHSHCRVDGIFFDQTGYAHLNIRALYFPGLGQGRGDRVWNCRFLLNSGSSVYGDVRITGLQVDHNYFFTGSYGCLLVQPNICNIHDNEFQGVQRSIMMYGGHENIIRGNITEGGIIGIDFLSFRSNGALGNICYGNIVEGNHIQACTEEGIAFDGKYNTPADWPENGTSTNRLVTVSSLTDPSPANASYLRINLTIGGQATGWAANFIGVPLDGNALGTPMLCVGSGSGFIDVETSGGKPPVLATNKILITSGFFSNVVIGNTLENCTTHTGGAGEGSIAFWGSSWHNVIAHNTIRNSGNHGINCSSQVSSGSGATDPQGYSGFFLIQGNIIHVTRATGSVNVAGYPIKLHTKNYGGGGLPVSIHTPGCSVIDNYIVCHEPIWISDCNGVRVENNKLLYNSDIIFDACTNGRFGRNYKLNALMLAPTETGGTTGTIKAVAAAQAASAVASFADVDTYLNTQRTNRINAEEQAP